MVVVMSLRQQKFRLCVDTSDLFVSPARVKTTAQQQIKNSRSTRWDNNQVMAESHYTTWTMVHGTLETLGFTVAVLGFLYRVIAIDRPVRYKQPTANCE